MDYKPNCKQELRYTRLWEGAKSRRRRGSASRRVSGRERVTGGVNYSRERSASPGISTAIGRKGPQQESHALSAHHSNRKASTSAGLSRKSGQTLHPPPPRSHSSLGFRETTLPHPQGFNLQEYIKRRGSASDIRIGINGVCSSDEYFEQYLGECEAAAVADQCEKRLPSSSSVEELYLVESASARTSSSPYPEVVPLCWDDQLRKAQPDKILPKKRNHASLTLHSPSPSVIKMLSPKYLRELLADTSVSITWQQRCLLPKTPLQQLLPPELQSRTLSSQHKVCVIPRADLLDEGEEEEEECDKQQRQQSAMGASHGWEVADIEDKSPYLEKHATQSPAGSSDNLSIYFHSIDSNTPKILSQLCFEVTFHPIKSSAAITSPRSSTHLTPRILNPTVVSDTECVLSVVRKRNGASPDGVGKLSVTCLSPRLILFSTVLHISSAVPHEVKLDVLVPEPSSDRNDPSDRSSASDGNGSRSFSDQERLTANGDQGKDEDEDITDLDVLAELFPDLHVTELINRDWPPTTSSSPPPPPTPFASPVHGPHLQRLSNLATNYRGESLPSGGKCRYHIAMTNSSERSENEGVSTLFRLTKEKKSNSARPVSLYRPVSDRKPHLVHRSYTSIAEQRLKTYCIH